MDAADYRVRIRFVVRLGRALHECGATSQRIERHLTNVTAMLGMNGSFMISPTLFTCAFWLEDEFDQVVHIERVEPADYNLGRLWEIDRLVEGIAAGTPSFREGLARLDALAAMPPNYRAWSGGLAWALIGGSFAALLSARSVDCGAAALLALVMFLIQRVCDGSPRWKPVTLILAPFVAGVAASILALSGLGVNPPFVVLSAIIMFVPGLGLTVALTEISTRHLISGASRLLDAAMQLLKLFFGAAAGMAAAGLLFGAPAAAAPLLPDLPAWKTWPALAGLTLALGVAFNIPRRKLGWGLLTGLIAFSAARLGEVWVGMHAGMFLGALAAGLFSNLYSRLTGGPGSILITLGIIPLVPGSRTYMILNHWISGEAVLPGANSGNQALMAFIALITGLLFANALLPTRKTL